MDWTVVGNLVVSNKRLHKVTVCLLLCFGDSFIILVFRHPPSINPETLRRGSGASFGVAACVVMFAAFVPSVHLRDARERETLEKGGLTVFRVDGCQPFCSLLCFFGLLLSVAQTADGPEAFSYLRAVVIVNVSLKHCGDFDGCRPPRLPRRAARFAYYTSIAAVDGCRRKAQCCRCCCSCVWQRGQRSQSGRAVGTVGSLSALLHFIIVHKSMETFQAAYGACWICCFWKTVLQIK